MAELINQTIEEKNMLNEDLMTHLKEREERLIIIEDINLYKEQLNNFHKNFNETKNEVEKQYYSQLLQRIVEEQITEKHFDKDIINLENKARILIENINDNKIEVHEIKENIVNFCKLINFDIDKEKIEEHKNYFIKLHGQSIIKCKAELANSVSNIKQLENAIKFSADYIENNLKPGIHAVYLL